MAIETLNTRMNFFQQGLYRFIQLGIFEWHKFYKFIIIYACQVLYKHQKQAVVLSKWEL